MSRKKNFPLLRTSLIILIVCGIAGLALAGVRFTQHPDPIVASATLQLSFEGAAKGQLPDGSRYDLRGVTSEANLTQALEAAGLTGTCTTEQIRDHLVVTGVYPDDIVDQAVSYESLLDFTASRKVNIGDYFPTTFSVTLRNGFDPALSREKLEELLRQILTGFQAKFIREGSVALDEADPLLDAMGDYDYPQQLQILSNHLAWIAESADGMYGQEPTFRYNGQGFNDISVQLANLMTNNITQLNAEITMNALTKDTARLLTQYQFEIRDLNNQMEKQNARLAQIDGLISTYDKNEIIYLSTADSLTKIDGNSSETYDRLMEERRTVTDLIADIKSRISTYTLRMNDLMGKTAEQDEGAEGAAETVRAEEQTAGTAAETLTAGTAAETQTAERTAETAAEGTAAAETETAAEASQEAAAELGKDEIKEAAQQAEELNRQRVEALEKSIAALREKSDAVIGQYREMLDAYNAEKLNEMSVAVSSVRYSAPKLLSGAFVKLAVKTAGPICLAGLLAVTLMVFIVRRREMKAAEK